MSVGDLHHVAIAVPSIERALPFYLNVLGMTAGVITELPAQRVRAVFLRSANSRLELIEPLDESSGVARFLAARDRPTLHHVCYEVTDIAATLIGLAAEGVELVDRVSRPGLEGDVAFLHPRAADGVLVELIQPHDQ